MYINAALGLLVQRQKIHAVDHQANVRLAHRQHHLPQEIQLLGVQRVHHMGDKKDLIRPGDGGAELGHIHIGVQKALEIQVLHALQAGGVGTDAQPLHRGSAPLHPLRAFGQRHHPGHIRGLHDHRHRAPAAQMLQHIRLYREHSLGGRLVKAQMGISAGGRALGDMHLQPGHTRAGKLNGDGGVTDEGVYQGSFAAALGANHQNMGIFFHK